MPDLLCLHKRVLHMSNRSSTFWKHIFTAPIPMIMSCFLSGSAKHPGKWLAACTPLLQDSQTCFVLRPLHAGRNKLHTLRIALKPGESCFQLTSFFHLSNERMFPLCAGRRSHTLSIPHKTNPFS